MNIITSFQSLDSLNIHYVSSIENGLANNFLTELNSSSNQFNLIDLSIQETINNSHYKYYLFEGSKTNFRKTIFPEIIDSCYKKLYSVLKKNQFIIEASAVRVIFCAKLITMQMLEEINSEYEFYDDHLRILTSVINRVNDAEADKLYYQKVINNLIERCAQLENDLNFAHQQVHNKTISTWY